MSDTDILIFIEDPGAINYLAEIPATLTERGYRNKLLADGSAIEYLAKRSIAHEIVEHPTSADRILASIRPRLLIVGTSENPDTLGLALIVSARSAEIESVGVVDAQANAAYRFRGHSDSPLTYAPDWMLVPDTWTKEAYFSLGYPPERLVICGHPHYDYVHAMGKRLAQEDQKVLRRSLLPRAQDDQRVIMFLAEVSTGLNPQQYKRSPDYTLTGKGTSTGRTEIVLEEFLDAVQLIKPRPYLVLRLHPKNTVDEFAEYLNEFNQVSKDEPPLELVYVADLVVGMTTMLLFEAALMGRPTLSIVPRVVERDWLPSIRMGITPCAMTRRDLMENLPHCLTADRLEVEYHVTDNFVFGAVKHIIKFLEQRLNSPSPI